jgi:hypothetical protein
MKSARDLELDSPQEVADLSATAELIAAQHTSQEGEDPESQPKKRHIDALPPQYSMTQLIDILRCMPIKYQPLIPYILTLELFGQHADVYIRQVYSLMYPQASTRHFEHTTTSCITNALSVLSLFSSHKTASKLQILSNKCRTLRYSLELPSSATWNFSVRNLLNGIVVSTLQRDLADYGQKVINQATYAVYAERVNNTFFRKTYEEADRCRVQLTDDQAFIATMKNYMVSQEYNGHTIVMMREHITDNNNATHPQNSHLYYMSCTLPNTDVHHAFILEQFYCPTTDSVRFRLYQSWIKLATLQASLSEQFSHLYAHSWDQAELCKFLIKLELFYSNSKPGQITEKDTFGHGKTATNRRFAPTFFSDELVGAGFEYYCQAINPSACLDHLLEMASETSPLHAALQREKEVEPETPATLPHLL